VFNGVTITMLLFIVFCGASFYLGARTEIAKADAERRRRFKSRVINCAIWGLFLVRVCCCVSRARGDGVTWRRLRHTQVYPQISSTTLLIFSCVPLEDGTSWLTADLREQCWCAALAGARAASRRVCATALTLPCVCAPTMHRTPKHRLHVGVGIAWCVAAASTTS
jgi:hypothetical protein